MKNTKLKRRTDGGEKPVSIKYHILVCKLKRRADGGYTLVSIKYCILHSFKEGVILLCQSILGTKKMPN